MIFFEGEKNKKSLLFFLVAVFMVFIIFQWIKINPIQQLSYDEDNDYWEEIGLAFASTSEALELSFEQGQSDIDNGIEDLQLELRQATIVESTKEFLENKNNASTSNATSTE